MRWPFFMKQPAALVEAYRKIDKLTTESAAKDLTIERLQARLDALTPARDPVTKRFVGKAVSNG